MNNRCGLGLILISLLTLAPRIATAQTIYVDRKQSHHELPGGLNRDAGQEMMADRLKELHELRQLQDQVQDLLKDPDFRDKLQNQFSEEQLRQLREKILKGDGLSGDRNWDRLLKQAGSGHQLDQRQIDVLRRWAERVDSRRTAPSSGPSLLPGGSSALTPPGSPANSSSSSSEPSATLTGSGGASFWDRLQESASDWFGEHMDGFAGDVVGALSELGTSDESAPLAELLRSMKAPDSSEGGWADKASGLSDSLSDAAAFLHEQRGAWDEVRSLFHDAAPSFPGLGGVSLRPVSGSSPNGDDWGAESLVLLGFGMFLLLLWKMVGKPSANTAGGAAEEWRLGPWPVSPDAVSTRQDIIRAFEYLALLCFGPSAGTHHHRDLADRLAERDGGDPARRRQAADLLAWLYEQSRYAPSGGALAPEEIAGARDALRVLAGVTAA